MILLNLSHPLTPQQVTQTEEFLRAPITQVISVPVQFDPQQPFLPQLQALMDTIPLTPTEWQNEPFLVNLPSLNFIASLVLAELHGRMGYFPPIIRLRPQANSLPPRYEVAEILNLQEVRDHARTKRLD